jgi:TatD DNase family protein
VLATWVLTIGYLPQARYVGEVGLDAGAAYFRYYTEQKRVFERIVQLCAHAGGKTLSVHSVRSAKEVLDYIEAHIAGTSNRVVLHWFGGNTADARRAAQLGCYFSINAEMLAKATGAQLLTAIPRSRMLTETDGPFTKTGSRPAVPGDVRQTTLQLAEHLGIEFESCLALLRKNLADLEQDP